MCVGHSEAAKRNVTHILYTNLEMSSILEGTQLPPKQGPNPNPFIKTGVEFGS